LKYTSISVTSQERTFTIVHKDKVKYGGCVSTVFSVEVKPVDPRWKLRKLIYDLLFKTVGTVVMGKTI